MKKIYKKLSIGLLSIIGITGLAYGAGVTISNFNQTVGSGDIIDAGWYNNVNTRLNGLNSSGSICQYTSAGAYACVLSSGSLGGGKADKKELGHDDIKKYHSDCTSNASEVSACASRAHRYCSNGCSTSGVRNCVSINNDLNYVTGIIVEKDDYKFTIICIR